MLGLPHLSLKRPNLNIRRVVSIVSREFWFALWGRLHATQIGPRTPVRLGPLTCAVCFSASAQSGAKKPRSMRGSGHLEAWIGIEPMNNGFADRPLSHLGTTPGKRQVQSRKRWDRPMATHLPAPCTHPFHGAGDRIRTGDILLGKQTLYH